VLEDVHKPALENVAQDRVWRRTGSGTFFGELVMQALSISAENMYLTLWFEVP
jgi:hypothetical protein